MCGFILPTWGDVTLYFRGADTQWCSCVLFSRPEPPPTPSIKTQTLCNVSCDLRCTADTQDLGPVSYEWKKDEGEWNKGDKLKNISSSDTPEKFSCRLKTRVRTSEASIAKDNPLYKPPGMYITSGQYSNRGHMKIIVLQNSSSCWIGFEKL